MRGDPFVGYARDSMRSEWLDERKHAATELATHVEGLVAWETMSRPRSLAWR